VITVKNIKSGLFRLPSFHGLMRPAGVAAFLALLSAPAVYAADEGDSGNSDSSSTPSEAAEAEESEKVPEIKIDQSGGKDPLTGVWLGRSGKRQEMHTISDRTVGAEGRSEISLFGSYQVNPKWTQHAGLGLDYAFHPREAVGFTVGGSWNVFAAQSPFLETELYKALLTPPSANAVLLNWETHVGMTAWQACAWQA